MKLIENLYCYLWQGMGNNCNSYLLAGEVPLLIDPGHLVNELREPCLERLLNAMEKDGFHPEDLALIINTHAHPDHSEANKFFLERSNAKLAFHKEEESHLEIMFKALGTTAAFRPDFYLKEGELNLGKGKQVNLQIFHTPGHSPGSISIYLPREKALFTGDLIFTASVGRTDIPGGDTALLKKSIEKIAELEIEFLLPGHMGIIKGREKVQHNFKLIKRFLFDWL